MKTMTNLLYQTVRTSRLTDAVKPPDPVRLLLCWALLGVGAGAVLCRMHPTLCGNLWLTQGLAVSDAARTLWDVCKTALLPVLALLCGILLSGFCAFGQPAALLLLFLRGTAFGLAAGACFSAYPMRDAIVTAGVLILPYAFGSMLLLAYAARDAMRMSGMLTGYLMHGTAEAGLNEKQRQIITGMQVRLLLVLLAAAGQTVLLWLLNDSLLQG